MKPMKALHRFHAQQHLRGGCHGIQVKFLYLDSTIYHRPSHGCGLSDTHQIQTIPTLLLSIHCAGIIYLATKPGFITV